MPCSSKSRCASHLSASASTTSGSGSEHERRELVPRAREHTVIEVGQRHDERDVVLVHERPQRRDVLRIVDPRHEGVRVGVVERGREPVDVGSDRSRAGRLNAVTMSTRWPAHVKRTPLTGERVPSRRAAPSFARRRRLVAAWLVACLVLFVWPPAESSARPTPTSSSSSRATGRLPPALELIRRGVAPVLALSTVKRTKHWPQAERLCAAHRMPARASSASTRRRTARAARRRTVARLARARGWQSIVVVTSTFHLTRRGCSSGAATRKLAMIGSTSTWWQLPEDGCRDRQAARAAHGRAWLLASPSSRRSRPCTCRRRARAASAARIFRSSRGERCSTYQTSSSMRSAHGSAARPWTCAQPVMPGLHLEAAPLVRRRSARPGSGASAAARSRSCRRG